MNSTGRGTLATIVLPVKPMHARPGTWPYSPGAYPRRSALSIYCADASLMERLPGALPMSMDLLRCSDWDAFERAAATAVCSVIAIPWLAESGALPKFREFRRRSPLHPTVLVTEKHADNLRHLEGMKVEELVGLHEFERELWAAVCRARATSLLRQMASSFEGALSLPPKLREAVVHAFRSDAPISSVAGLAAAVGCDRRTLWRQWRQAFGSPPPLQLSDFVDWLLLLRATGLKVPGVKWSAVAAELGVHEHTIARIARRLAGLTLRDLAGGGLPFLSRLFVHHVLRPLLTPTTTGPLRAAQ